MASSDDGSLAAYVNGRGEFVLRKLANGEEQVLRSNFPLDDIYFFQILGNRFIATSGTNPEVFDATGKSLAASYRQSAAMVGNRLPPAMFGGTRRLKRLRSAPKKTADIVGCLLCGPACGVNSQTYCRDYCFLTAAAGAAFSALTVAFSALAGAAGFSALTLVVLACLVACLWVAVAAGAFAAGAVAAGAAVAAAGVAP